MTQEIELNIELEYLERLRDKFQKLDRFEEIFSRRLPIYLDAKRLKGYGFSINLDISNSLTLDQLSKNKGVLTLSKDVLSEIAQNKGALSWNEPSILRGDFVFTENNFSKEIFEDNKEAYNKLRPLKVLFECVSGIKEFHSHGFIRPHYHRFWTQFDEDALCLTLPFDSFDSIDFEAVDRLAQCCKDVMRKYEDELPEFDKRYTMFFFNKDVSMKKVRNKLIKPIANDHGLTFRPS
ncbi:MAG: hypothetical protein KDJ35_01085 [Alphaproteobacteria bacterium]|nr:hypothetical protein [Alphaproteobacteria bacterium]